MQQVELHEVTEEEEATMQNREVTKACKHKDEGEKDNAVYCGCLANVWLLLCFLDK